jgi:hypothetical protein
MGQPALLSLLSLVVSECVYWQGPRPPCGWWKRPLARWDLLALLSLLSLVVSECVYWQGPRPPCGWWMRPLARWDLLALFIVIIPQLMPTPSPPFCPLNIMRKEGATAWEGIQERTLTLRFLGIISRVLRLEVSTLVFCLSTRRYSSNLSYLHWSIVWFGFLKP